jgi:hypothetical protein
MTKLNTLRFQIFLTDLIEESECIRIDHPFRDKDLRIAVDLLRPLLTAIEQDTVEVIYEAS